ncbi:MAG: archaeal proteasome endopeptidase complex subunit alpha [Nitrososphaerota archaeon]|jgi:proteasome alpha subunit|nr:archaeal proteasome endopeptidase complex subunit alpha [Nitrososphaerota archaeon]MDG6953006.1 archaeal proteasome endopeptidase complex subunit alpha [Nitrososphaerota archaeon]MDG6956915.1 archaeal proteasome endopeptidase complex subunit alpha [Nitrososphaerota archaeon]MDG6957264.1 archaeal proteasome endopeptidase complex subunit alpha [Nitrososphaerota archaeon]MDG6959891.1 archaeal proteasome endopeptidase complex subunit alpha [Nitrososphaerota archaeon]
MFAPSAGYDRAITIFSPDGRLYQVEYALETVRRGNLAVGVQTKHGVVLAVEEKQRKLQSAESVIKMFQIDDHVGAVGAGYIPDARIQVDNARVLAQSNRLIYDEPVDVEAIAKRIADMNQQYTQYAGVRPFGVSLIIAGVDEAGPVVYLADPTGTYSGFHAIAIGQGSDQVNDYLEKNYSSDLNLEGAVTLAIECIYLVSEDKSGTSHIKVAVVEAGTKKWRRLAEAEIGKSASSAKTKSDKPPAKSS